MIDAYIVCWGVYKLKFNYSLSKACFFTCVKYVLYFSHLKNRLKYCLYFAAL